jgi:NitT/TauT family transport system ATP-binding protein
LDYLVEISDVSLAYGDKQRTLAVEHLDLKVPHGDFVAVVGPSGCGKSTIMKLVTGLLPPTSGSILVADKKVSGPLKIVGMAFQNPNLLPWRSTLKNVILPLEVTPPYRYEMRRKRVEFQERARALLKIVGLADFAESSPWQLSGGMQQRASLCRALVHEPSLLMLDEPFARGCVFGRHGLRDVEQARSYHLSIRCRLGAAETTRNIASTEVRGPCVTPATRYLGAAGRRHASYGKDRGW